MQSPNFLSSPLFVALARSRCSGSKMARVCLLVVDYVDAG